MATAFMRWLERRPRDYDRGIRLLTLGRLPPLKQRIVQECGQRRVLELGCGTGELAQLLAEAGAQVTAIDRSQGMLAVARERIERAGLGDRVEFHQLDLTAIGDHFERGGFDTVVATLVFSELPRAVQVASLRSARELLAEGGQVLLLDEVLPQSFLRRLLYRLLRIPALVITWLLTRTTTSPLVSAEELFRQAGFEVSALRTELGGSLTLFQAWPRDDARAVSPEIPRLRHQTTLKTALLDVLSYTNRILPPYAKVQTGLYAVGQPDRSSPVLVTGNYDLTVRRLVRELDGKVDCWLLVANSRGVNVWCAAGGGHFTAEEVISALHTSAVEEQVDHHALILPQLCANGVDGWKVRRETGWGVHWGPVRADQIPEYLRQKRKKTPDMRQVSFPLRDRLEMTTAILTFYGLLLGVLSLLLWREHLLLILSFTVVTSYIYGVFLPWLPGKDGLEKGAVMAAVTLLLIWGTAAIRGAVSAPALINQSLGLGFLAFFIGAEFQGMSPRMRGEQANWSVEIIVGLVVLGLYGAGRLVLGG